jgi:hypothetical protein
MGPQHRHGLRIEGDGASATSALGLTQLELATDLKQRLVDRHLGAIEIDVAPRQSQCLSSSAAGHGEEVPEAVEAIVPNALKEGEELLGRPGRELASLRRALGWIGGSRRIDREAIPAHRIAQGTVQGGMDSTHGGR